MRVLLLNPASRGVFRVVGILFPPIGLLYVAAATRARRHRVKVIDRSVDLQKIDFSSYDVIGIHSDTTRFERALELARQAKEAGARVVMGGPHPCFTAEQILETGAVDAIVRGEGEETFPDLLDAWEKGSDPSSIPGLILPTSEGVVDGGERERIKDLDSLPFPARDLIDLSLYSQTRLEYRSITPIHTSRGCPHRCRFCSSSLFDGIKWRARSADNVLAELDCLVHELGYGAVAFMDDNFTFSPDRVHEICDGILRRAFDLHWWCFSRVDTIVRHPEMVQHMAEAGLRSIFIGIESPSTKVLDHFQKGIEPEKAVEAVKILKRNGIHIWAGYILGAPEEHRQDLRATIRFAKELDTETAEFTLLTPYPGTEIYEELKNQIIEEAWEKYDAVHSVYKHPCIPKLELQAWLAWANISFYFRHGRSIRNFFRFLSNRKFGGQIISKVASSRRM